MHAASLCWRIAQHIAAETPAKEHHHELHICEVASYLILSVPLQIYSKTGQWEDAVKVLDTLQAQVSTTLRPSLRFSSSHVVTARDRRKLGSSAGMTAVSLQSPSCFGQMLLCCPFSQLFARCTAYQAESLQSPQAPPGPASCCVWSALP
jgi:hypothetical protein